MTREEAIKKVDRFELKYPYSGMMYCSDLDSLIDKIYDDFESRICENCKYDSRAMTCDKFI